MLSGRISRKWRPDFKTSRSNESYYDLVDDYDLIEASFLKEYGIRLRDTELEWDEFLTLLSGVSPDTPLGVVVSIRSENDTEVLKKFTPEQRKIRNEWRNKQAQEMDMEAYERAMENMEKAFLKMR